jgi:hypothetical protein
MEANWLTNNNTNKPGPLVHCLVILLQQWEKIMGAAKRFLGAAPWMCVQQF